MTIRRCAHRARPLQRWVAGCSGAALLGALRAHCFGLAAFACHSRAAAATARARGDSRRSSSSTKRASPSGRLSSRGRVWVASAFDTDFAAAGGSREGARQNPAPCPQSRSRLPPGDGGPAIRSTTRRIACSSSCAVDRVSPRMWSFVSGDAAELHGPASSSSRSRPESVPLARGSPARCAPVTAPTNRRTSTERCACADATSGQPRRLRHVETTAPLSTRASPSIALGIDGGRPRFATKAPVCYQRAR